jgi:hypothetical protein
MSFRMLVSSVATVGMAFAIAAPASAQEHPQKHYSHMHYAHSRYHHYSHYGQSRQIIVHPQETVQMQSPSYVWGPVGAVGSVVGGTGQAVQSVFVGAGGIVGGIVGGVFGGVQPYLALSPRSMMGAAGAVSGQPCARDSEPLPGLEERLAMQFPISGTCRRFPW